MRSVCALVAVLVFSTLASAQLPEIPRLLLDRKDLDSLKQRIGGPFASQWKEFRNSIDRSLNDPVMLPPRGGNWSHNYVCPEHGARLKQSKKIGEWQWEHICPVGPHILHGDSSKATLDFDGNAISALHMDWADRLIGLGIVYQISGDEKYAARGREILLAYADKYLSYPLHDNQGKPGAGGHVASQSLTEASWLIQFVQGADLIWNALSDDDRKAVAEKVLRPALNEVILPHNLGIHNIQCRQNSAIGLVGFLLDDQALIYRAIDDPKTGFRQQIARGVNDDGMWLEGSGGYHFFTIDGLWPLAEAARHCGIDLYTPRFKSMFQGPLVQAMPDLRLPNFNDSGIVDLSGRADQYELAYARWHDPQFATLAAKGNRTGRLALLYGAPETATDAGSEVIRRFGSSRNLSSSGFAILQNGAEKDATWLCLKYGPHGGGHGHYDKNHFILYAHGQIIMPDAGTHAYGSPLHNTWDKQSLAHNTLVVDEKSQSPSQGKCIAFGTSNGVDYAVTDAGEAYKDADLRLTRTVAMIDPNLIVVIDQVRAEREHTLDLALHLSGKLQKEHVGQPWTPKTDAYQQLANLRSRTTSDAAIVRVDLHDGQAAQLTLAGGESTEVITGTGIGETTSDRVPIVLFRRHAKSTAFVWAIDLNGNAVNLQPLAVHSADGTALHSDEALLVRVPGADRKIDLLVNPTRADVRITESLRSSDPFLALPSPEAAIWP